MPTTISFILRLTNPIVFLDFFKSVPLTRRDQSRATRICIPFQSTQYADAALIFPGFRRFTAFLSRLFV